MGPRGVRLEGRTNSRDDFTVDVLQHAPGAAYFVRHEAELVCGEHPRAGDEEHRGRPRKRRLQAHAQERGKDHPREELGQLRELEVVVGRQVERVLDEARGGELLGEDVLEIALEPLLELHERDEDTHDRDTCSTRSPGV